MSIFLIQFFSSNLTNFDPLILTLPVSFDLAKLTYIRTLLNLILTSRYLSCFARSILISLVDLIFFGVNLLDLSLLDLISLT